MKTTLCTLVSLVLFCQLGSATPKAPSFHEFRPLLDRSPFNIKKVEAQVVAPKANTSLTLRGVAKMKSGWFVTVVDRKAPKVNIRLREGEPATKAGLRLVKVNPSKKSYRDTTVTIMSGGRQITVAYNPSEIKNSLSKAAATSKSGKQAQKRPAVPTKRGATKSKAPRASTSGRRPRVRRVPKAN